MIINILSFLISNIESLIDFIFSKEAYSGTATLLSVITVLIIYWIDKRRETKAAAVAIWFEMKNASKNINIIKSGVDWYRCPFLLSGDNWSKYSNILYKKLDNDSYESINEFYILCNKADNEIKELRNNYSFSLDEKSRIMQQKYFSDMSLGDEALVKHISDVKNKISNIDSIFIPGTPVDIMLNSVNIIQNITQSYAGSIIKKLAGVK